VQLAVDAAESSSGPENALGCGSLSLPIRPRTPATTLHRGAVSWARGADASAAARATRAQSGREATVASLSFTPTRGACSGTTGEWRPPTPSRRMGTRLDAFGAAHAAGGATRGGGRVRRRRQAHAHEADEDEAELNDMDDGGGDVMAVLGGLALESLPDDISELLGWDVVNVYDMELVGEVRTPTRDDHRPTLSPPRHGSKPDTAAAATLRLRRRCLVEPHPRSCRWWMCSTWSPRRTTTWTPLP
jgi:hypothetical protein